MQSTDFRTWMIPSNFFTRFLRASLVGLEPRVQRTAGDTGLGADVGDAFTALIAQDKLTFLVGGIFHRYFLLNVDMSIVAFRGILLKYMVIRGRIKIKNFKKNELV